MYCCLYFIVYNESNSNRNTHTHPHTRANTGIVPKMLLSEQLIQTLCCDCQDL